MLGEDPAPACAAWERSVQIEAAGKLKELFPKIDDVDASAVPARGTEDGLAGYLRAIWGYRSLTQWIRMSGTGRRWIRGAEPRLV